jgi:hypothetical protein
MVAVIGIAAYLPSKYPLLLPFLVVPFVKKLIVLLRQGHTMDGTYEGF